MAAAAAGNRQAGLSKRRWWMVVAVVLAMVVSTVVAAQATHGDFDFEVDGNLTNDGGTDWTDVITDDDYEGPAPNPALAWDDGPGILLLDDVGNPDETLFKPAGKFFDPAGWQVNSGSPGPSQNDLSNTYVYPVTAPGLHENHDGSFNNDLYLVMGMERLKKEGTFDLDFEFNQQAWDGSSGSLVRTEGDFVAAYELSGNPTGPEDLTVKLMVHDDDQSLGLTCEITGGGDFIVRDPGAETLCPLDGSGNDFTGFVIVYFGPAGALGTLGEAEMNVPGIAAGPWGSYDTKGNVVETIGPFEFAEARINLSEIGIEPKCPGFGSVHAKSRSSLESTSDLKDLAGPSALEVSCALTARKYHDLDANGSQDEGEPFLSDWDIELWKDNGDTPGLQTGEDSKEATVATDANGEALFSGLADGTYHLVEVCPAGADWIQSEPAADSETPADCGTGTYENIVVSAQSPNADSPYDFGNYQNGTKSGVKFHDLNANGAKDGDEPGLEGWTINAYADDGDGALSQGEIEAGAVESDTTQDGSGDLVAGGYSLSLKPGDYVICEDLSGYNSTNGTAFLQSYPTGSATTSPGESITTSCPDGNGYALSVASGDTFPDNDFGNYEDATKSGLKWEDRNTDGVQDATEPKLDGWTINIYADDGDGALSQDEIDAGTVDTDTTADGTGTLALGEYSFTLTPGSYIACEVVQSGWEQTFPTSGPECPGHAADAPNLGYAFTLTSGQEHEDNDFGNVTRGDLSGTKYKDANDDGVIDTGESGLEGWTINLYEDDGSGNAGTFLDSTATDANGAYEFVDLLPGDYVVCEAADFDGNVNWTQTFPSSGPGCSDGLDGEGLDAGNAANGHAFTVAGGDAQTGDFANSPLSDVDVSFDDLTGYTQAEIICGTLGEDSSIGSTDSDGDVTVSLDDVRVSDSIITCTIEIVDP